MLGRQVEEDWLRQAKAIQDKVTEPLSTKTDARGACDGLKNGQYGFHTGLEPNPWWQTDLGGLTSIRRIIIFNRLDYAPGLHNADHLRVLTSTDGDSVDRPPREQGALRRSQRGQAARSDVCRGVCPGALCAAPGCQRHAHLFPSR